MPNAIKERRNAAKSGENRKGLEREFKWFGPLDGRRAGWVPLAVAAAGELREHMTEFDGPAFEFQWKRGFNIVPIPNVGKHKPTREYLAVLDQYKAEAEVTCSYCGQPKSAGRGTLCEECAGSGTYWTAAIAGAIGKTIWYAIVLAVLAAVLFGVVWFGAAIYAQINEIVVSDPIGAFESNFRTPASKFVGVLLLIYAAAFAIIYIILTVKWRLHFIIKVIIAAAVPITIVVLFGMWVNNIRKAIL